MEEQDVGACELGHGRRCQQLPPPGGSCCRERRLTAPVTLEAAGWLRVHLSCSPYSSTSPKVRSGQRHPAGSHQRVQDQRQKDAIPGGCPPRPLAGQLLFQRLPLPSDGPPALEGGLPTNGCVTKATSGALNTQQ